MNEFKLFYKVKNNLHEFKTGEIQYVDFLF